MTTGLAGQRSRVILHSDPLYRQITPPNQTNDQFQQLITTANDSGFVYTSAKGKEKEVQSQPLAMTMNEGETSNHPMDSENSELMAANQEETSDHPIDNSGLMAANEGETFDHSMENSWLNQPSVLMVGVQCPDGRNSHAVFQVLTQSNPTGLPSASAIDLYESLLNSDDAEAILVNIDVSDMEYQEIRLATARLPIFMDELPNFPRSKTGFRQLGFLQELDPNYLIKPVLDGEEKQQILEVFGQDQTLDIYVLYILTEVSLIGPND